jgi:hypothetical protein
VPIREIVQLICFQSRGGGIFEVVEMAQMVSLPVDRDFCAPALTVFPPSHAIYAGRVVTLPACVLQVRFVCDETQVRDAIVVFDTVDMVDLQMGFRNNPMVHDVNQTM